MSRKKRRFRYEYKVVYYKNDSPIVLTLVYNLTDAINIKHEYIKTKNNYPIIIRTKTDVSPKGRNCLT